MHSGGGSSSAGVQAALGLAIFSAVLTVAALVAAALQTFQLRAQVRKLAGTESALQTTQETISNLSERTETTITGLSDEMYEVLGLTKDAYSYSRELFNDLAEIASGAAAVLISDQPYLAEYVRLQIASLGGIIRDARNGRMDVTPTDIADIGSQLVELANEGDTVYTTSYVNTKEFWDSQNREAIRAGHVGTHTFSFDLTYTNLLV